MLIHCNSTECESYQSYPDARKFYNDREETVKSLTVTMTSITSITKQQLVDNLILIVTVAERKVSIQHDIEPDNVG